ncbi:MAG TPA: alpha-amylase family glycosyl hydrolase [Syntrophales bacterium]|nr:alpha-amylase family glycosyl hydrolase [Syntrophales bacterium]
MPVLPKQPLVYEINTWVWLNELSGKHKSPITLATVPAEEWAAIASFGFDAVWLMGVWQRSPIGTRLARSLAPLLDEYRRALPDFTLEDIQGSPYCIQDYSVDEHLGGPEGLYKARRALADCGLGLILDFVPNHVALDHHWVLEHPEFIIQGDATDLIRAPKEFFQSGGRVFACGRDPNYPPWQDVAQLNAFHPGLRDAAVGTLLGIADQCDGVRCDMSILLINRIFRKTWGSRSGKEPQREYWVQVIEETRERYRDFAFIAEAYWDLEWELQQQGFDYCYDKRLYDRLIHESADTIRLHLSGEPAYQHKLVRFIENHDEPRAAATFDPEKARAASMMIATLPGARLFYDGQFEGRKVRLPVQLGRQPEEHPDRELRCFYRTLLESVRDARLREDTWSLCELSGWPDNDSFRNLVAWRWVGTDSRHLIIVNLSDRQSQGRVRIPGLNLSGRSWQLVDLLSGDAFERDGNEMTDPGLFVDLKPWGYHFLEF